jgi:hypothetical protein
MESKNITNRIYKLNSNKLLDLNKNMVVNLQLFKFANEQKLIEKYKVKKKRYLSINQTIKNNIIETYTEDFEIISQNNTDLHIKYIKNIVDNEQFPPLNKYDFEESYTEEIYDIKYNNKKAKLIVNNFENYIEFI